MRGFDANFSDYLETYETDEMFNNFFLAGRKAYIASYKAAGGKILKSQPALTLVKHLESKKIKWQ